VSSRIIGTSTPSGLVLLSVLVLGAACGEDRIGPRRPVSSTGLGGTSGGAGSGGIVPVDAGGGRAGAGGGAGSGGAAGGGGRGGDGGASPIDAAAAGLDAAAGSGGSGGAGGSSGGAGGADAAVDATVDMAVVPPPDVALPPPDVALPPPPDVALPPPPDAAPAPDLARDAGADLPRDVAPDVAPPPPDLPPPPPDLAPPPPDLASDTGSGGLPAFCASYPPTGTGGWQSAHVRYVNGRLDYPADAEKNRIPDFSFAGYRYGEVPIPDVPEVMHLAPITGDNTTHIQAALDAVGARPLVNGLRGALVLGPGRYEVAGTLRVNRAGVVLRGSGDGADPAVDTIIVATGDIPHQRTVIIAGSGSRNWNEGSPRSDVVAPFVQVSARELEVASATGFAVGDAVVIHHPSTQAWIDALMGGGVVTQPPWTPGTRDIVYHRFIRRITGNTLTLDAPIFNHLDRALSQTYVAKASSMPYLSHVGVENLRIDIQTAGGEDENHAWTGLSMNGAIDSWARKVTALHFGWAGVEADGALRVTIDDSSAMEPVGIRTGGRFYNFAMEGRAQLVLVRNCFAADGRHSLDGSGASTTSGNVFYRCRLTRGGTSEGGHRQWSQGMLFDNVVESATSSIVLINRGDYGTQHGWGCVHSVIWNFNSRMQSQKPPTGQNYAISSAGQKGGTPPWPGPDGVYELKGPGLSPTSLYEAQLCDRLE
jgi:hypothetical protein